VETTEAFGDVLLGERLAAGELAPDDARLCTQLVYGTLAWQGRLDHHLAALLRRPVGRVHPDVRAALRLGLFQLLFLDRIPPYAAIDTSVSLVAPHGAGARGLVNAVLRRAAAGAHTLALPPAADRIRRLSVEYSHPAWLVERWSATYDADDLVALLRANNEAHPTTLRVNRERSQVKSLLEELSRQGIGAKPGRWASTAVVLDRGVTSGTLGPAVIAPGLASFQSEASQVVVDLLAPSEGMRILDACAAPGAKTTAIAERLGERGRIVALDPRAAGLFRLRDEAHRLGLRGISGIAADARLPPLCGAFDAVLVDAPCSGLGTLRRHPEVRWRRRPEDIPRLAALQRAILDHVAPLIAPGGILVYAVCTLTAEESEDVIHDFVERHPRFGVEPAHRVLTQAASPLVDQEGFLRSLPSKHDLDGFFAARLVAER
jgi:16S rRNA (cytosine967-C5)-methyltransferase